MNDPQQKRIRALIEAFRTAHPDVLATRQNVTVWALRGIKRCDCQNCINVRELDARIGRTT